MILRGISSPVQGEDAVNKDYVDEAVNNDRVSLTYNGITAYSVGFQGKNDNAYCYCFIPLKIDGHYIYYFVYVSYNGDISVSITELTNATITGMYQRLFSVDGQEINVSLSTSMKSINLKYTGTAYSGLVTFTYSR